MSGSVPRKDAITRQDFSTLVIFGLHRTRMHIRPKLPQSTYRAVSDAVASFLSVNFSAITMIAMEERKQRVSVNESMCFLLFGPSAVDSASATNITTAQLPKWMASFPLQLH